MNRVTWFGRGPWENYQDRKTGSFVGLYSASVQELYTPYIRPQENGYRTDVRWIEFSGEGNTGIRVEGMPLLCFSALPYTYEDLASYTRGVKHACELVRRDFIDVNIDLNQSGVGGDDSWGAEPYPTVTAYADRIPPDKMNELPDLVWKLEGYLFESCIYLTDQLGRLVSMHSERAIFQGEGADNLFSSYKKSQTERLRWFLSGTLSGYFFYRFIWLIFLNLFPLVVDPDGSCSRVFIGRVIGVIGKLRFDDQGIFIIDLDDVFNGFAFPDLINPEGDMPHMATTTALKAQFLFVTDLRMNQLFYCFISHHKPIYNQCPEAGTGFS